jgi:hypothetical protein
MKNLHPRNSRVESPKPAGSTWGSSVMFIIQPDTPTHILLTTGNCNVTAITEVKGQNPANEPEFFRCMYLS